MEVTPWLPLRGQALQRLRLQEPTDVSPWSLQIWQSFYQFILIEAIFFLKFAF